MPTNALDFEKPIAQIESRIEELAYPDFMPTAQVRYPPDEMGVTRAAQGDYEASPDNWVNWGWSFYDSILQASKTFSP
jgi:hypothetical protein